MTNCLQCGKPVEQTKGKRPKLYCDDNCRARFYVKKGKPEPKRVNLDTHNSVVSERDLYKKLFFECQERTNPLINAARGRDKSGINEDKVRKEPIAVNKPKKTTNEPAKEKQGLNEAKIELKEDLNIPPMPVREKGEDSFDYAARKNQWKQLYNQ